MKRLKSAPIMFWVQDLWPESLSATGAIRSPTVLRMVGRFVRFVYQHCDRILIQSQAFSPFIKNQGIPPERLLYFPNSAEEFYQPMEIEQEAQERSIMPNGFRVMFAGNIGAAQDFDNIIEAADRLKGYPDIHWIILGDGRRRSWVETQVNRRGLDKTFHLLGRYPVTAMPRFFSLADALLVTLNKDPIFSLTIPAKVQSYLACGKPIIASIEGEGARIIEEAGAGLVCSAENPQGLAEAIITLYRTPRSERSAMGVRGRDYYRRHFDHSMLLNQLDLWMKDLCRREIQCVS
jgi:colanic acid biosynthesis glycosyl transferase WcaI